MKAYTTLYDDCTPELPGAEPALVLHYIKRTCNDFYERTLYSREVLAGISIVAGTATYTITASDTANFEVGKILEVRLISSSSSNLTAYKMQARTPEQLDIDMPDWDTNTGSPRFYTQRAIDQLTLAYVPADSCPSGLIVTIAKLPLYAGAGIDDPIYEKFMEALGYGIKGRLMRMPKKPWSNPELSKQYLQMFENEVAGASAIAAKGFGRAPLRSRSYA